MSAKRITGVGANLGPLRGNFELVRQELDGLIALGADVAEVYASALGAVAAGQLIPSRVRELAQLCQERPIALTLHAPIPIDLMDRDNIALHRSAARVSVDLAAEIGASVIVIHAGRAAPEAWHRDADGLLAFERDELRSLGDHAREAGVRIALENISPNLAVVNGRATSYSLDPAALARQLATLDHPAVVGCLDYSHANQGAGLQGHDLLDGVCAMSPVTGHIHISETTGVPTPPSIVEQTYWMYFGVGDMHAPLGTCGMDLGAIADASPVLPGTLAVLEIQDHARAMLADSLSQLRTFADRVNTLPIEGRPAA